MTVFVASHLDRNCLGIYCFRRVIPNDLRSLIAVSEITRSTRTRDPRQAAVIARAWSASVDSVLRSARELKKKNQGSSLSVDLITRFRGNLRNLGQVDIEIESKPDELQARKDLLASLLHEETYRAGKNGPATRMTRHYYDLWRLIRSGVADRALADTTLFQRVIAHRQTFFRRSKAAQDSLRPGSLRLVPSGDKHSAWRHEYQAMREAMFFGDTPEFDDILSSVGAFK